MKDIILHVPKNLSSAKQIVKILSRLIRRRLPAEISVAAVSEEESRRVNRRYRGKDKPANVLSFIYPALPRRAKGAARRSGLKADGSYGEIIVCPAVIRREARKQGNSYGYQLAWMILHGMIHLSGLHHEDSPKISKRFIALEKQVFSRLDVVEFKAQNSKLKTTA